MKGTAFCFGAVSVVNAIATGYGAAFGIGLRFVATVELTKQQEFHLRATDRDVSDASLAHEAARVTLCHFGVEDRFGAHITTKSEIPVARGLKSSSVTANAVVLATAEALNEAIGELTAIRLGVEAARRSRVTVTGAFDDACASFFGQGVLTDNQAEEILERFPIDPELKVLLHVPQERAPTQDVDVSRIKAMKGMVELAIRELREGKPLRALLINGLAHSAALKLSTEVTLQALRAGAETAGLSGTGPATAILVSKERQDAVEAAVRDIDPPAELIRTTINRQQAGVIENRDE